MCITCKQPVRIHLYVRSVYIYEHDPKWCIQSKINKCCLNVVTVVTFNLQFIVLIHIGRISEFEIFLFACQYWNC